MVVGSLPPPAAPAAEALRELVVGLLAEGHSVEVVAMDPVATAHRYIVSSGIAGCLQLARMVPDFDSVVVQVQPGLPVRARAGQLERHLSVLTLAFALRPPGRLSSASSAPTISPVVLAAAPASIFGSGSADCRGGRAGKSCLCVRGRQRGRVPCCRTRP